MSSAALRQYERVYRSTSHFLEFKTNMAICKCFKSSYLNLHALTFRLCLFCISRPIMLYYLLTPTRERLEWDEHREESYQERSTTHIADQPFLNVFLAGEDVELGPVDASHFEALHYQPLPVFLQKAKKIRQKPLSIPHSKPGWDTKCLWAGVCDLHERGYGRSGIQSSDLGPLLVWRR